jgi:predicted phage terminase large subunit-like protein
MKNKANDDHQQVLGLARRSLAGYASLVYPSYQLYMHHSLLVRKLEAAEAGNIRRLMIFMPPRMGKSLTTTEIFPAWYHGRNPAKSIICASYSQDFVEGFGRKVRNYEANPLTNAVFPELKLSEDSTSAKRFDTTAGGSYYAVGREGSITGRGGDLILIDDPLKDADEARSDVIRKKLHEWYSSVLYTRRQPDTVIILIQTRWHHDDLAGWLLREHSQENWDVLSLPAIADADEDWRKEGDPLWPERFSKEDLAATRCVVGSAAWAALFQQRPTPEEGAVFKTEWWKRYSELPARFSSIVQSWDTAFKTGRENDYSVCTTWGVGENAFYLLDRWKQRVEFPQLKRELTRLANEWRPNAILIEDKASGQSLLQELKQATRFPVLAIKVDSDKLTRAHAASPLVEAGRVLLPQSAPWLADYLDTMSTFPAGAHDDDVDSTSQALNYLRTSNLDLGLLDFYKQVSASSNPIAMIGWGADKSNETPEPAEELRCEKCSSDFIQTLGSGIKRCGQCGMQWDPRPKPAMPNPALTRQALVIM